MSLAANFPRLTPHNHRITSPASPDYNCIAWSVGDTEHRWQPGVYWPSRVAPGDYSIDVLEGTFKALGFETCAGAALEIGYEKVALFGDALYYSHAPRPLPDGRWTSKLGGAEDISSTIPPKIWQAEFTGTS